MSEKKHTPGPWSVSQKNTDPDAAFADEHYQISGAPFGHAAPWIAETYGGLLRGQAEANARLIAAAPELLALLEEVVQATASCECGLSSCSICGADSLNGRIRAALAKATGESK